MPSKQKPGKQPQPKAPNKGRQLPGKPVKGKKKGDEPDDEDALVAVVMADSFNSRLLPLTASRPRALLPMLGVPLIDWTLEWLALADVEHVYILVRSYPDQIRAHVAHRQDQRRITIVPIPSAMSVGDAMRELDNAKIIKNDFLLVHADGVGNLDLEELVRIHKERRKVDKDAIMTVSTMRASGDSKRRPAGDTSVMVIDPQTQQLVHYEPVPAVPRKKHITLPVSLFDPKEGIPDIEVRNDLVDCGVDVCSVDVPPLFTENFDYQELRRDFVPGILQSEILTSKIFLHVATSSPLGSAVPNAVLQGTVPAWAPRIGRGWGYGMRVRDSKSYDVVAKDILGKWLAPLGPGGYLPTLNQDEKVSYTAYPAGRYQAPGVYLSLSTEIGRATMLGCRTRVGKHTTITHSVLGSDNLIGDQSQIHHSYLWANVQVGDRVHLDRVILGDNVIVGNDVRLGRGCVVADGCIIGSGITLPPFTRVGFISHAEFVAHKNGEQVPSNLISGERLGPGGKGFIWPGSNGFRGSGTSQDSEDSEAEEEDDDDEDPIEAWGNASYLQIGRETDIDWSDSDSDISSIDGNSELASSDEEEEEEVDDEYEEGDQTDATSAQMDRKGSQGTAPGESTGAAVLTVNEGQATAAEAQAELNKINDFYAEATASLARAASEGHRKENVKIELSTLRMASNVEQRELVAVVFVWLLQQAPSADLRSLAPLLQGWASLLASVAQGEEVVAIGTIQSFCAATPGFGSLFGSLLMGCYNLSLEEQDGQGIFTEDGLIGWYKSRNSVTPEESVERLLALPQRLKGNGNETIRISVEEVIQLKAQGREVIETILAESDDSDDDDSEDEDSEEGE